MDPGHEQITVLDGFQGNPISILHEETDSIELVHQLAMTKGCELEKLTQIFEDARYSYMFPEVSIKITKDNSHKYIDNQGQCKLHYRETLEIDLGLRIVLTSNEGVQRNASGCKNKKKL